MLLTTLEKAKPFMGIALDDFSQDAELEALLSAASTAIEERCRRKLGQQKYTDEKYDGVSGQYLTLQQYPIISFESAKDGDQPLTDVEVLPERGMLYRSRGWPAGQRAISVTYTAGYITPDQATTTAAATLPETLGLACIYLAKFLMENRNGIESERIGDYFVKYDASSTETILPPLVEALIRSYVRPLS